MRAALAVLSGAVLTAFSCGGGSSNNSPPGPLSLSIDSGTVIAGQDGTSAMVTATVTRPAGDTNSVSLTVTGVPSGVDTQITSPGVGSSGTVTFTPLTTGGPAAGGYSVTLSASDGSTTATASLSLVIAIVATVQSTVNTQAGQDGRLNTFMSTSFQPAEWDYQFFANSPGATTTLGNLQSQHIRLQPVSQGTPQDQNKNWDFSTLDAILNPVIGVTDRSPELQLAVAPEWMNDSNGHLEPSHYQDFAGYAANVVEYYNTATGFTDSSGKTHVHQAPSVTPVTWWGIFNEPNINGLTADEYVALYNLVVPAMQAAHSQVPIRFVAVELSDFEDQPQSYIPALVQNVIAPVDAVATHFYSSCNQSDLDQQVFSTIPGFVADLNYIYTQLRTSPALENVPVWVTENNVNADYADANGYSVCNPGQKFVTDQRGTSAFFAAWRPYVFSQLAQAGAEALYHWNFDADEQYGEVDYNTGKTYLSYWVDYYLQRYYPTCPPNAQCAIGVPPSILNLTTTESTTVETLATKGSGNSVVVMIANHAVNSPNDNNGPGAPRSVIVDVSALGPFSSATQLTMDATTDPTKGPTTTPLTPASRMTVTLDGYGLSFLQLNP